MFDNDDEPRHEAYKAPAPQLKLTMFSMNQQLLMESDVWDVDGDFLMAFGEQAMVWPDAGQFTVEFSPSANLQAVARGLRKWAELLENETTAIHGLIVGDADSLRLRADGTLEPFDADREIYNQLCE